MRGQEVQRFFREAVWRHIFHLADAARIDRWSISHQTLAEGAHPGMILIQLLPPGEGAPRDQFVNVGITGVIGDMFALQTRPRWARDDLARLRLNIAEADFLILFIQRQMSVVAAGKFSQRLPGFHRHLAVGFRRQT